LNAISKRQPSLPIFSDAIDRPPSLEHLRAWLLPVAAAVRNPPTEDDFELWLAACALAFAELPAAIFNVKSQREMLLNSKFRPSPADIFESLDREMLILDPDLFLRMHHLLLPPG
jgi:hypothetical protein